MDTLTLALLLALLNPQLPPFQDSFKGPGTLKTEECKSTQIKPLTSHSPEGASENVDFSSAPRTPLPWATGKSGPPISLVTMGANRSKIMEISEKKQTNTPLPQTRIHLNGLLKLIKCSFYSFVFQILCLFILPSHMMTSVSTEHIFSYFSISIESFLNFWLLGLHEAKVCLKRTPFCYST